jgi:hypothetical protein
MIKIGQKEEQLIACSMRHAICSFKTGLVLKLSNMIVPTKAYMKPLFHIFFALQGEEIEATH